MTASAKMQDYLAEAYRIAHNQQAPYVSASALAEPQDARGTPQAVRVGSWLARTAYGASQSLSPNPAQGFPKNRCLTGQVGVMAM